MIVMAEVMIPYQHFHTDDGILLNLASSATSIKLAFEDTSTPGMFS